MVNEHDALRRKRPALVVPLQEGASAQQWLRSRDLLDKDVRVGKTSTHILFPLSSIPEDAPWPVEEVGLELRERPPTYTELLKQRLPPPLHQFIPGSFDRLGELLLLKLETELQPYKEVVGQSFLDSLPVRSVFQKGGDVTSRYRTIPWECIAGDPSPVTTHRMEGLRFRVDVTEVYFNPRLNNEYARVAGLVDDGEVVVDMFAGVGPFVLTVASQRVVQVFACDLNPHAVRYLRENIVLNQRLLRGRVEVYEGDARQVVPSFPPAHHVLMNLPGHAPEFLDVAVRAVLPGGTIYLHQFANLPVESPEQGLPVLQNDLEERLNSLTREIPTTPHEWSIRGRVLRDVAPSKSHLVWDITSILST